MASSLLSQQGEEDDVDLFFVIPRNLTHTDCDKDMQDAFQICVKNDLNPIWKTAESCLELSPNKKSVFVLQQFSGVEFEHLKKFKCIITGPRCLYHCLERDEAMPPVPHPIFTAAMKDLVITSSGGGVEVKKEIKEKVELMAGTYCKSFSETTTHVVVSSVTSTKYEKALELGIPVMTHDWVNAVWKRSLKEYVRATSEIFNDFKCPPFLNLNVCASGLIIKELERVMNAVDKHGGNFDRSFTQKINVLVLKHPKGEKFKYAQQWEIPCVEPKWIYDSIQNGHALPTKSYEVKGGRAASSPTMNNASVNFSANVSTIPFDQRTHIDETMMNSSLSSVASYCPASKVRTPVKMPPPAPKRTPVKTPVKTKIQPCPNPGEFKCLLSDLNLSQAKRAGPFLDGCGVFLLGWNPDEEEILRKIIKCSGAARFTDLSERVSHVLVGNLEKPFLRTLKGLSHKPHVVNIKWLIQSVTEKGPASEEPFNCLPSENVNIAEAPSPLSKKGMALLQNFSPQKPPAAVVNHSITSELKVAASPHKDDTLLAKYISADSSAVFMPPPPVPSPKKQVLQPVNISKNANNSDVVGSQEENDMFFTGLKFVIVGLPEESANYAEKDLIEKHGGEVVRKSFKGVPDYAVVPLTGFTLRQTATEIITILWLQACLEHQTIVPVEYYHQPVVLNVNKKPLEGCVLGLSGFCGKERQFIIELSEALGGKCQEVFAKKTKTDAKASSHLICKSDVRSAKYDAALKWFRPAVYHSWLLACASSGSRVSETSHLVNPKQVVKPLDSMNNTTTSFINSSSVANKRETSNVATLQKLACVKTPERSDLMNQVDKILNYVPSPNPHAVKTPPVPIGISDNPTPGESKRIQKWLDKLPGQLPPSPTRRDSTPLHELRRRVLQAHSVTTPEMLHEVPIRDVELDDLPESATAMRTQAEEKAPSPSCSTPTYSGSSVASRKLFNLDSDSVSPIEGQLDKLKRLIATPEPETDTGEDCLTTKSASLKHLRVVGNPHKSVIYDSLKDGSQPYAIKWEDPVNLKRSVSEEDVSPNLRSKGSELPVKRKSSENAENAPEPKKPHNVKQENVSKRASSGKVFKFCLSAVDTKEPYISTIKKLGGVLIDSQSYQPEATHLLLVKPPQRSEKLLAFIAAGKWVLHLSYLVESEKHGKFLREEDFEWGNPCNNLSSLAKTGNEEALSRAVYRWRTTITKTQCGGAFKDLICKILSDKALPFSRLVAAGGGKVLHPESKETPSLCLVTLSTHKACLEVFAKQGIPCVPPTFLYDHLTLDPIPTPESRAYEEYKTLRMKYLSNQ